MTRPTVGSRVRLAPGFEACSDAKDGPLKLGEVGTVRTDDHSSRPFHVEGVGGKMWWYDEKAIELADGAAAAAPTVTFFLCAKFRSLHLALLLAAVCALHPGLRRAATPRVVL